MKRLLTLIFIVSFFFSPGQAQDKKTKKNMRKLKLSSSEQFFTDETLVLYPRGFIYNLSEPDSVFYFGCFSSDIKDFTNYIEKSEGHKVSIDKKIIRMAGQFNDTIKTRSLENLISHFKDIKNEPANKKDFIDYKYVVIYYYESLNGLAGKYNKKNFRYFGKYAKNNPDKQIKVIGVSTNL